MRVAGDYLVIGNWKMHLDRASAGELTRKISEIPANNRVTVGIAPPSIYIPAVFSIIENSPLWLGAQDCHDHPEGAFTGNISARMLADNGCQFTLVGHSERRQQHHESDALVKAKAAAAIGAGLHVVLCVGESLAEREAGNFLARIETQLAASLPDEFDRAQLSIAYEPIWAIGTGKTATVENISEVHGHIQDFLKKRVPASGAGKNIPRILYGGSVKANNALEILSLPVVNGVLVGGASLDADAFTAIINAAARAALEE